MTEGQTGHNVHRPPRFGGFHFQINDIEYNFGSDTNDVLLTHVCAEFGKGAQPDLHEPRNVFVVIGVESEDDETPNPSHLITCTPLLHDVNQGK